MLRVVGVAALMVLAGGCATLMALVLVHYERRRREFAVRLALGAARGRLVGQLAVELTWLMAAAGCAAMLMAYWGVRLIPALSLPGGVDLSRLDLSFDYRVIAVGAAASALTVAVGACLPLVRFTRPRLAADLIGHTATATAGSIRLRQFTLALHVTATVIVLVAAALFVRTVQHGFSGGLGVDMEQTVFVTVDQGQPADIGALLSAVDKRPAYEQLQTQLAARRAPINEAVVTALAGVPGVERVGIGPPLLGPDQAGTVAAPMLLEVDGKRQTIRLGFAAGSASYLEALSPQVVEGRLFESSDEIAGLNPRPMVVSSSFARSLWPGRSAVGRVLRVGYGSPSTEYEVVGVIADVAFGSLRFDPARTAFIPVGPQVLGNRVLNLVVRRHGSHVSEESIRAAISSRLPPDGRVTVQTAGELVAADLGRERLGAWFFSGFSLVALILGVGGVFGLVAYLAESRRREFGIRLALGASLDRVLWISIRAGVLPSLVGVVLGLIGAGALAAFAAGLVHGIGRLDVVSYAAGAAVMLAAAGGASLVAAWRVRRISASVALRAE